MPRQKEDDCGRRHLLQRAHVADGKASICLWAMLALKQQTFPSHHSTGPFPKLNGCRGNTSELGFIFEELADRNQWLLLLSKGQRKGCSCPSLRLCSEVTSSTTVSTILYLLASLSGGEITSRFQQHITPLLHSHSTPRQRISYLCISSQVLGKWQGQSPVSKEQHPTQHNHSYSCSSRVEDTAMHILAVKPLAQHKWSTAQSRSWIWACIQNAQFAHFP